MNAAPLLSQIATLFQKYRLEAVLIGNAAAAIHGAPVTTIDVGFMFRATPANLTKLKKIAKEFGAVIMRPYYPVSDLYRIQRDADGLQIDLMRRIHGVRSFLSLRSRATPIKFGKSALLIASLEDILKSKKSARRAKDLAVIDIIEATLNETKKSKNR